MKHLGHFSKDEEGLSGAVTATLIIATLTLIFTGIYTIVVPVWVERVETNHMHQVANDFINMKKNIETQIEQGDKPLTMSSTMTLKPDPTDDWFGVSGRTFPGVLHVDPYSERCNLTNTENAYEVYGASQGSIYFIPKNQEYAEGDTLTYIYSNGAVMKVQKEEGVMIAAPVFNIVEENGNRTLYFSTIKLYSEPTSISGSKSISIETRTLSGMVATYEGGVWDSGVNVTINATSNLGYAKVYKTYYEETLDDLGYVSGTDYTTSINGDNFQINIKNIKKVVLYMGTVAVELR